VYLFVFGELVDAYQSRTLPHDVRLVMALRARFFLDMWINFLARYKYPRSRHCISREAIDIVRILTDGLVGLILIHRDHLDGLVYPLLPWKHSTEVCEHLFGLMRKIIQEFSFLDFLYMVPQLRALIDSDMADVFAGDGRNAATGYTNTWLSDAGVSLAHLAVFPSDTQFSGSTTQAWNEALSFWAILGVSPQDVQHVDSPAVQTPIRPIQLPSISAWFHEDTSTNKADSDSTFNSDSDSYSDSSVDYDLEEVIREQEQNYPFHDERLVELKTAAISLSVDQRLHLYVTLLFPSDYAHVWLREDLSEAAEDMLSGAGNDHKLVHASLASIPPPPIQLPALELPPEAVNAFDVPLDDSLDFAGLVLLRDIHEPAHVKKANRPRRAEPLERDSSAALAASSSNGTGTIIEGETRKRRTLMNEIARDLHGVLRHAEALSSGPGTARLSRWMEKDTGVKTGNALNAELSAGQQANKV
jgi:hypothetical protein